jgi:hypothetical protein
MTKTFDTAVADYIDFKIEVRQTANNRGLSTKLSQIEVKYARKQKMIEAGVLSQDAAKEIVSRKLSELAGAYADHVIVAWEGKYRGKKLPDFSRENVIKLLTDPENDALFADLVNFSVEQANFQAELQKDEEKNLSKTSDGGGGTARK